MAFEIVKINFGQFLVLSVDTLLGDDGLVGRTLSLYIHKLYFKASDEQRIGVAYSPGRQLQRIHFWSIVRIVFAADNEVVHLGDVDRVVVIFFWSVFSSAVFIGNIPFEHVALAIVNTMYITVIVFVEIA